MKIVYIIRHAKSDWSIEGQGDIDRPLNARGYKDAHNMGLYFKKKNFIPQAIISSPAIRALTTALIISEELLFPKNRVQIEASLYESGIDEYLDILKSLPEEVGSVGIFGHNPIVSDLSSSLSGQAIEMPTCAVARFSLEGDKWNSLSRESIKFLEMITPKTINLT
ncbi:MAG: histidine phosphatase family protein [Bacteroidetes bacterium]|nr:histidine phosphatase family protein [Bacteroidota bacterium]MBP6427595.1 histidine phosphatase family protein [Bacteroidia bacterium]MBK8364758.1 histidine phosphatase family protein [Bacteroidota bacterium]MBK9414131.1 histidine phosphatase family protein [Bacteroidota bacterium]MBL0030691.1 histidine phosphatase family protein [Bacteroidota bacterium]